MSLAIWVAIGLLAVSVLPGLLWVMIAPDSATRAVVEDLVFSSCIEILAMFGTLHHSSVLVGATLLALVPGILAAIVLVGIMTRGRR